MPTTTKIQGNLRFGPHESYYGLATYDNETGTFQGEVIGLRDVVTFQGTTVGEVEKAFTGSVDDYLAFCKERGEAPEKPFSGKFVTRVAPTLHKKLSQSAQLRGQSLNAYVETVLSKAVFRSQKGRSLRKPAKKMVERTTHGRRTRKVKKERA